MVAEYAYSNMMMGTLATIIGMGGVFCILAILVFTTWLLNKVCDSIAPDEKKTVGNAPAAAPKAAPAPAAAPAGNKNAKVAAIMAAVTAAMGTSEQLRFTEIKRVGGMLPWAAAGNSDIMHDRAGYTKGGNK